MDSVNSDLGTIIHRELLRRGWNQSDFARALWPNKVVTDARGYSAPYGRDRVSSWINGKSSPNPMTLARIAEVLELDIDELEPGALLAPGERANPPLEIRPAGDAWLVRVNKTMPLKAALQIAAIIEAFDK
jgi:transcriptional regulator with XRE-family HTH domain